MVTQTTFKKDSVDSPIDVLFLNEIPVSMTDRKSMLHALNQSPLKDSYHVVGLQPARQEEESKDTSVALLRKEVFPDEPMVQTYPDRPRLLHVLANASTQAGEKLPVLLGTP